MYKGHRVAVVMPIHNEEAHVARAISRVPRFVDLIVAVDDGSTDNTWASLAKINAKKLVKLKHETNRGVGAATKTGYLFTLSCDVDLIAVMDGDGQMDGQDLWRLLECAIGGVDYVKGNRLLHSETISRMPLARWIGNRTFSWLTRRAAEYSNTLDAQCGFTVIRRAALRRLNLDNLYDRYGFPNEMFFASQMAGLRIESVPVKTIYEDEVSGINPLTAVPTIMFLIARNFMRRKLRGTVSSPRLLPIRGSESNSAK